MNDDLVRTGNNDLLSIAGKPYRSRLLTGTGKFVDLDETRRATDAAGAEIVTVAIRRMNIGQTAGEPNLLDVLPPDRYTILPNTAGCYTADDAVRTCRLARELLDGHTLVKLEVLGDPRTLFPDVVQTLAAAETLVRDGFHVMVYTTDDPILAKRLEEIGCRLLRRSARAWASRTSTTCWKSSRTRRCRSSWMPASAPRPTPRSQWSWVATGY
jgi:thiazole synthase